MVNAFPNPTVHALVILNACRNDLDEARDIVRCNYIYAQDNDAKYWLLVLNALSFGKVQA